MKSVVLGAILLSCTAASWAQTAASEVQNPSMTISPAQPIEHDVPPVAIPYANTKLTPYQVMKDFKDPAINIPWAKGQKALEEQRWFRPAGNNAAEYYLQAHEAALNQSKVNAAYVESTKEALRALFPYVLMSAESALERNDKQEATRLIALLGKMDPNTPAVQRLNLMVNDAPIQEIR